MNPRLGYACINTTLRKNVSCNKTCRFETIVKKGHESGAQKSSYKYSISIYNFLTDIARTNLTNMYKIISWSRKNNIFFYRMSSDMFPHINNKKLKMLMKPEHYKNYFDLDFATDIIYEIGKYVQKYLIRLTMHPSHFNQLATNSKEVLENTVTDLQWHTRLLDLLELGADSYIQHNNNGENILKYGILCLHGGGTYKNKQESIKRWIENFKNLPKNIQNRLCLENCEKSYCVEDLLPICKELKIPLILDFHHYNCWAYYHKENPQQTDIEILIPKILETWEIRNIRPKFHLSDQAKDKNVGAHHDYVEEIPKILFELRDKNYKFDVMIEAKMKEMAVLKLYEKYNISSY